MLSDNSLAAGPRTLPRLGSWVRIPSPAPKISYYTEAFAQSAELLLGNYWQNETLLGFQSVSRTNSLVLEDFRPWSRYVAILTFYELLKWLNGNQSIFETNDCGLRPPRPDSEAPDFIRLLFANDPVVLHGRLTLFCRDLAWNVSAPTVDGLKRSIHDGLRDNVPLFSAVVMVGEWRHFFIAINRPGRAEIRYEPHWLGMDIGYDTAHIEIESIAPERAHLPITEIGYRSTSRRQTALPPTAAPSPSSKHGSKPKARHPTGAAMNRRGVSLRCSEAKYFYTLENQTFLSRI